MQLAWVWRLPAARCHLVLTHGRLMMVTLCLTASWASHLPIGGLYTSCVCSTVTEQLDAWRDLVRWHGALQDMLNFWGTAVQAVLNGTLLLQCIQTARMPADRRKELELDGPSEASPSKAFPSQTANEN